MPQRICVTCKCEKLLSPHRLSKSDRLQRHGYETFQACALPCLLSLKSRHPAWMAAVISAPWMRSSEQCCAVLFGTSASGFMLRHYLLSVLCCAVLWCGVVCWVGLGWVGLGWVRLRISQRLQAVSCTFVCAVGCPLCCAGGRARHVRHHHSLWQAEGRVRAAPAAAEAAHGELGGWGVNVV
jgi:hypothetical protein